MRVLNNSFNFKQLGKVFFFLFVLYFTYLMWLITIQYIPINFKVAFLNIKQTEIKLFHYQLAFFSHVYTSIFVLILGLFQFSNWLRNRYVKFHRNAGKIYIGLVLGIAGPSGLVMGYYANGGWFTQISFCLLATLWMVFTYQAYTFIKKGQVQKHKNFMLRSYALTLSAISLRLFKWLIVIAFELPPMDTYYIVAWAGWLVNLGIAEIIIFSQLSLLNKTKIKVNA